MTLGGEADGGRVGLGQSLELLLVLVERGEVPGEEMLRLQLDHALFKYLSMRERLMKAR